MLSATTAQASRGESLRRLCLSRVLGRKISCRLWSSSSSSFFSTSSFGELNARINWPWEARWRGHHLRKASFSFDSALQEQDELRRQRRRRRRDRALVRAVAEGRDQKELARTFLWHNSRGRGRKGNPDPLPWGFVTPSTLRVVAEHRRGRCP